MSHLNSQPVHISPQRIDRAPSHLKHLTVLSLFCRSHDVFKALVDTVYNGILVAFSEFLVSGNNVPYLVGDIHFYRLIKTVCLADIGYDKVIANHLDNKRKNGNNRRCYHQKDYYHVGNLYSLFDASAFKH
ncbi:hypothetical protein SDC9_53057 [bioreactor metagenome]|uniref:Uncharacterized protein n=1 Tax=bioreactor metagenome TaxID=1076179 RepID=A0A644WXJ6_9ZZZZ